MLAMFRRGLFYTYLSIYLRHYLGLGITETTLFATLPMLASVIGQTMIWGRFSDRLQLRRTLIIAGELLAGFGTLLLWYCHTLAPNPRYAGYVIIGGLTIVELFWSMSNISWSALISDIYGEAQRTTVQGRLTSIGAIGRIAGVWIGGILYDGFGHVNPGWGFSSGTLFFIAAGLMFISTLPMLLVPEGGTAHSGAESAVEADTVSTQRTAGTFFLFLVGIAFVNVGRNSVAILYAQYLTLDSGFALSSEIVSYITNTRSIAVVLTGVLIGAVGRRIGNGVSLLLGIVAAVVSLLVFAFARQLPLLYLGAVIGGCSQTLIMVAGYTLVSVLIPAHKRGRLFSMYNATIFLSWGLGATFIAGPLADALVAGGSSEVFAYRMTFVSAAVITSIGLAIQARLVWKVYHR